MLSFLKAATGSRVSERAVVSQTKNCSKSSTERRSILFLPAFLIGVAGYGSCALLVKNLLFSFHKAAKESLTKDSHTSLLCLVPFSPCMFPIVSFVPH